MFEDDEYYGFGQRARRKGPRFFLDSNHETASNMAAWRGAAAAAKSGDAAQTLLALREAKGSLLPLNSRGNPARNAAAKAILALQDDPAAWRRLREASYDGWRSSADAGREAERGWEPSSVSALDFLWAANPEGVARAAALWRQESLAEGKWWDSLFLARGWDGPVDLRRSLKAAVSRHFQPEDRGQAMSDPGQTPGAAAPAPLPNDPAERSALARILTEVAKSCVDELWRHEQTAGEKRLKGETVWMRGGSEWGLRWFGADVNVEADPLAPARAPITIAAQEMVAEGLAQGAEQAAFACRKVVLATQEASLGHKMAEPALRAWTNAYPNAPEGLPMLGSDWMPAERLLSLCESAGVSEESLGRWLAGAGAAWSAPAGFDYRDALMAEKPFWGTQNAMGGGRSLEGMSQWGPMEWALMSRPQAARAACVLGAKLAPGVEAVLEACQERANPRGVDFQQALAWAQACRLAESSVIARAVAAPKRSAAL